jgi:hypothetical protein
MQLRNLRAAIGALSVVVVATFAPVSAVNAYPTDDVMAHCAVEIHPIDAAESTADPVCFDTEDEVIAYVHILGERDSGSRAVSASTIVGTVYSDANSGGQSLTFWGTSGCSGVTFGFPSLPSGWDNSISSARASNGCWVTLYTSTGYGGSRLNCTPYCASIGSWNDNVKSLVFRPTGTFG